MRPVAVARPTRLPSTSTVGPPTYSGTRKLSGLMYGMPFLGPTLNHWVGGFPSSHSISPTPPWAGKPSVSSGSPTSRVEPSPMGRLE